MSALLQAILTTGAALGAVVGLIVLAGRGTRMLRLARPTAGRRIVLREALALDRTRRLHIVACNGRELLVLTGAATEQIVAWLPIPQPGAEPVA